MQKSEMRQIRAMTLFRRIAGWPLACITWFYYNQGLGFQQLDRYAEALASFDNVLKRKPDHVSALIGRIGALSSLERHDEALADCDKVMALEPDSAEAYHCRGLIFVDKGDTQQAEAMFRKALTLKPDFAWCWDSLVSIRKYKIIGDSDVEQITSLLNASASAYYKASLYFAMGKIHDDCGLYDEAFAHYQKGNQTVNQWVRYDPQKTIEQTDRIINVFNREFFARSCVSDNQSSPIFIVGMPRSGTTLTAQILSNHPAIASAGELTTISELVSQLPAFTGRRVAYPEAAQYMTPEIAAAMVNQYEQRLRRDAGSDVPFVIDKMPHNFMYLGFISLLFPKARIIHCLRHPLDTALSNYFQRFLFALDYSFDLNNIGHFYGEYERLMAHWRSVLPIPMLEVRYEDTVADTKQAARRMLDFLGLEWDDRCLSPHTNPNTVHTASHWQVRQPIYRSSTERWRHYEKHLAPLKAMLAPAIAAYDASTRIRNAHEPYADASAIREVAAIL